MADIYKQLLLIITSTTVIVLGAGYLVESGDSINSLKLWCILQIIWQTMNVIRIIIKIKGIKILIVDILLNISSTILSTWGIYLYIITPNLTIYPNLWSWFVIILISLIITVIYRIHSNIIVMLQKN